MASPLVTIVIANNTNISGEQADLTSCVNAIVFACSALVLSEVIVIEGLIDDKQASHTVI